MKAKTNSSRLRWIVVAAVCVLVTPALLLMSCDNLFGSDSSSDPSVPEMPIAALVAAMGTMEEAIEAAEEALPFNGGPALQDVADIGVECQPVEETFVCTVSFDGFEPFDSDIEFRTVELSGETALTGQLTVAFAGDGTSATITVNGTVTAANYPANQLTFSNVVLTFSDDGENGDDFPDTVSGTVTIDGTTWQMDHVFQVFLSGVLSTVFVNPAGVDYLEAGGVFALFWNIYGHVFGVEEPVSPDPTVAIDHWENGEDQDELHLSFSDHEPADGISLSGTVQGNVDKPDPENVLLAWPIEILANLTVSADNAIVLRDAVLRLPQDWEDPGAWDGITWDGQLGVNGVFFRLDYLLDVMHVIDAMRMLD